MATSLKAQFQRSGGSFTSPIQSPQFKKVGDNRASLYTDGFIVSNPLTTGVQGHITYDTATGVISFISESGANDWTIDVTSSFNENLWSTPFFREVSGNYYVYMGVSNRSSLTNARIRRFDLADGTNTAGTFNSQGFNMVDTFNTFIDGGDPAYAHIQSNVPYVLNYNLTDLTITASTLASKGVTGPLIESAYYLPDYSKSYQGFFARTGSRTTSTSSSQNATGIAFQGSKSLTGTTDHLNTDYVIPTGVTGVPIVFRANSDRQRIFSVSDDTVCVAIDQEIDVSTGFPRSSTSPCYFETTDFNRWITEFHEFFEEN